MKVVIQRVKEASVRVESKTISSIHQGLLILLGIHHKDSSQIIKKVVKKILELRIFNDENSKMNLSCLDTNKDILLVSQFTLYADCSKGRRPSYVEAAKPDYAFMLYKEMIEEFRQQYKPIQTGKFGAMMDVQLVNDGPVTIILEEKS